MKVFISHRASDGEAYASAIQRELELRKISAFLYQHHESEITMQKLRIEDFIYPEIEQADCLILVLSPKIFDGADDPEDWVRLEIEKAQSLNKLIIPIKCQGFSYPDTYPCDSIKEIGKTRAIEWKTTYPKTSIHGVINLLPKTTLNQRLHKIVTPIAQWCRNTSSAVSTQCSTTYAWFKERVFYNPIVRKWCSNLIVKPFFVFIVLAFLFFVIPVFVFGRLDSASSGLRNQLADCYNWGILVKQDFQKANYYYRKSVEADSNAYAMAWVARHAFDTLAYADYKFREFRHNPVLDTLDWRNWELLTSNADSLYIAITHLLQRSGDKGYVSAYYNLADILSENVDLDLNERYDQAIQLLNTPNRYNNYDYIGLWENIVYRIEFQVSERRSGNSGERERDLLMMYSDKDYEHFDISIAKKHLNTKISKRKKIDRIINNAYAHVIKNCYFLEPDLDSALVMEYHPMVDTYINLYGTHDDVTYMHTTNLIKINQTDKAFDFIDKHNKHNAPDSLLYAHLLIEKGKRHKAQQILHKLHHKYSNSSKRTLPLGYRTFRAAEIETLYLLGKSYSQHNDSLASTYYSEMLSIFSSSNRYRGLIQLIDTEIPKFLEIICNSNWNTIDRKFLRLSLYFPRYDELYFTYNPVRNNDPVIDVAIYHGLCKLRQKTMEYIHIDRQNSIELLYTIDTLISRHVQPDRLVYEYEYMKYNDQSEDNIYEYKYDKDKDIIFSHAWWKRKLSEKMAYFYIVTDKIRNLEAHCDQYFRYTIKEAVEENDELYKYYYHWADNHGCDLLKHYITKSRSEHAVYLLENYNDQDAQAFEMQCIAKYGYN